MRLVLAKPLISRVGQEDWEFQASIKGIASLKPTWATRKYVSSNQNTEKVSDENCVITSLQKLSF